MISHEVNNSLAPIASLVNSVKVAATRPEHHGRLAPALDTIAERAAHLKTFIEGYARLARLPAPKAEAVDWTGPLAQLQGLYADLSVAPAPSRPGYLDAVQMEQVLVNLVKNSVEAGSAESDVALSVSVQDDGSTDIEILDRGRGFSEEALAQALLPLFTTKEHGSGMGLTLCKEIVEAHGGSLGLSNREGGGARIRIVLPGPSLVEEVDLTRSRLTLTYG
jgi:nitrogen fixation/metabolism regulation signal transduction histidine kinase